MALSNLDGFVSDLQGARSFQGLQNMALCRLWIPWSLLRRNSDTMNSNKTSLATGSCCSHGFCSEKLLRESRKLTSLSFFKRCDIRSLNGVPQVYMDSSLEVPQRPPAPFGWPSLGVCGNALIMRVGTDARCFHQQGLTCGRVDFGEQMRPLDMLYDYDHFVTSLKGSTSKLSVQGILQETTVTTKNGSQKLRGKNKQKKSLTRKTATLSRDLFERSSFHLFEIIFYFPFMNLNAVAASFQMLSRESLRELEDLINLAAAGLAGMGVTLVLIVASRMLCINAAFDRQKIVSLAMGVGFLLLSLATKRVAEVLKCIAHAYSKARAPKKEHLLCLQKELQGVAINILPLLVTGVIGAG